MRAAIIGSVLVLGSATTCLAMPIASPPALPIAISTHGCHQHYAQDMSGWPRHDKGCQTLRGLVRRKGPAKS